MRLSWSRVWVPVAVVSVVLAMSASAASAAPRERGAARASSVAADRDRDRVADDFAPRLRSAGAGELLDVLVSGLPAAAAQRSVGRFTVRHDYQLVSGFAARMTAGQARAVSRDRRVTRIEPDRTVRITDAATDSDYGAAAARSAYGLTGSGAGICIVDTGVDAAHEQIAPRAVTFADFVGTSATAYDDHGHGTHVASIALGDGSGGPGAPSYVGVAPAAALFAAKVLDGNGYGSDGDVIAGVDWCAAQYPQVRVISMSLGDPTSSDGADALSQHVNAAVANGVVVVVAAGNSGDDLRTIGSPGAAEQAVTVGAASDWSAPAGADYRDDGITLAHFSSRGPTADGRTKPDVVAPGVTVRAAQAGSASGYVTFSGTSMATPYVAGAVALALQAVPGATPAGVKAALTGTAEDWGPPGKDVDWGAGLLDVKAFVSAMQGGSDPGTSFPTHQRVTGTVPNNGSTEVPITVGAGDLGQPLAITITLDGQAVCSFSCLVVEWSPDLDVELLAPDGSVVAASTCTLGDACGIGRQETLGIRPAVAGTYRLRVYGWTGSPNNGQGGPFAADISRGPLGGTAPPPPPVNQAPVANAGPDLTKRVGKANAASFTLDGRGSSDPDGVITAYAWSLGGSTVGTGATLAQTRPAGTYVYTLTVTDDDGATGVDTVTVTVRPRR